MSVAYTFRYWGRDLCPSMGTFKGSKMTNLILSNPQARAVTWRLLAGYLPANTERRAETLQRKRADYQHLVGHYYDGERDDDTYRQIHIDIPRMSPLVALFQQPTVQVGEELKLNNICTLPCAIE